MSVNHSSKYADLTNDQYMLIGKVIIEFSNLDFLLGCLLSRLLIMPDFLGRTYNDLLMADKLIQGIENAIRIHEKRYKFNFVDKEILEEIKGLITQVKDIKKNRNNISHLCWSRQDDSTIFGTKFSGTFPTANKPDKNTMIITNIELEDESKRVFDAVEQLSVLVNKLPELEEDKYLLSKLKCHTN